MATLVALPVEVRNQIYDYVLHSTPLQESLSFSRIKSEDEADRPQFHYVHRPPPEEPTFNLKLTSQQIYQEVNNAIAHLVKSNQINYRFDLCQVNPLDHFRLDFLWIQFPFLTSVVNTIEIDVQITFRVRLQLRHLFFRLQELVQLFTRTLKQRQGSTYIPLTVNNLIINLRFPKISSLTDENTEYRRAVWKLEEMKRQSPDSSLLTPFVGYVSARKCNKMAPRFKKVVVMNEDEMWTEQENLLLLSEQWTKNSEEPAGYSRSTAWCWLTESRNGCKGKERLYN
jgi:hypothetical protein